MNATPHTATYEVTGMTCGHCVQSVTEEVSALTGVKDVSVELNVGAASQVTVVSDEPLDTETVRGAVDEAGYQLVG
ncbi:heavy-metal-associated domain-containing protein [uncultured Cellulomonas sp.]|uniref:heavy-metal-associated domain-containing protein n=1 Tax=uncultured Cellulomonas sp. TaxID=189682 RepID=UPI00261BC87A|nr:heavy metal-associated domain-containing protein [uncultured Cellulomonas sp.]